MRQGAGAISKKRSNRRKSLKDFRIPSNLQAWSVVIFCLFVLSGGVYNILENPPPFLPYGDRYITIDPRFSEQTVYESIFVFLCNAMMFLGLWISYRSTQVTYDRSKANKYLILGISLSLVGFMGSFLIIEMKKVILR